MDSPFCTFLSAAHLEKANKKGATLRAGESKAHFPKEPVVLIRQDGYELPMELAIL